MDQIAKIPVTAFLKNTAAIATLFYAYVSVLGVYYKWLLFRQYDIYVLNFFEIQDFVLSGLKQPVIIIVTCITAVTFYWILKRYKNVTAIGLSIVIFTAVVLYVFSFIHSWELESRDEKVHVQMGDQCDDICRKALKIIGTTDRFLFLYDKTDQAKYIIEFSKIRILLEKGTGEGKSTNLIHTPEQ